MVSEAVRASAAAVVLRHGKPKIARRARAEKMRRSLRLFFREAWPVLEPTTPLDWNWHLDALCDHVQVQIEDWIRVQLSRRRSIVEGSPEFDECLRLGLTLEAGRVITPVVQRLRDLLVNVPPGTGKSRVFSVATPAWVWSRWPSWKAQFLSVNPKVALRDSVYCRQLILSDWYQSTFEPGWRFREDQDTKGLFRNTATGSRGAIGYFANIVGDRADATFVDDPNDPEEVYGEAHRDAVNGRWDNVLKNRRNDMRSSTSCVIQQRVHVDDLSGHILQTTGETEGLVHLRIAMEREAPTREASRPPCSCRTCTDGVTPIGWRDPRAPGELMDPVRFPESVLAPWRSKSLVWASQYQQDPLDAAGNMFKPESWRFWRHAWEPVVDKFADRTVVLPDKFDGHALSMDCAFLKTEGSDLIASGAWARKSANRYLLDLAWDRMDFKTTVMTLVHQAQRFPEAREKFVENKANGPAVINILHDDVSGLIPILPEEYGSKVSRAAVTAPEVESGNVFIPLHAPWRDRYIAQHTAFPNGPNDDVVDQQSQLLLRWKHSPTGPSFLSKPGSLGQRRI